MKENKVELKEKSDFMSKLYESIFLKKNKDKYEFKTKEINLEEKYYRLFKIDDIILFSPIKKRYKEEKETQNKELDKEFLVFENVNEAKELSQRYASEIKSGNIIGIKGFDGKYYVFKKEYYNKLRSLILGIMKTKNKDITLEEFKNTTKEPENALKGALEILKEEGYIYEAKPKLYRLLV